MVKHYTSEYQIEREVERLMDKLDAAFLAEGSDMTIDEYHFQTEEIELWAKLRYRELR